MWPPSRLPILLEIGFYTPAETIFKATYSGVPVYEMPCKGVAVMKRRSDGWLNATQVSPSWSFGGGVRLLLLLLLAHCRPPPLSRAGYDGARSMGLLDECEARGERGDCKHHD